MTALKPTQIQKDAVERAVARVRQNFTARLMGTLGTLKALADGARGSDAEAEEPLTRLSSEAHKIVGLARTVGFSDLDRTASEVQLLVNRHLQGGEAAPTRTNVLGSVGEMISEVERVIREHPPAAGPH